MNMMNMQAVLVSPATDSGKFIVSELLKAGKKFFENDVVAVDYIEGEEYGTIMHNFSNTFIKVKLSDVDFEELKSDGILIWATWKANV